MLQQELPHDQPRIGLLLQQSRTPEMSALFKDYGVWKGLDWGHCSTCGEGGIHKLKLKN
uniref:Uncharacterized protein n=1 Tax=Helianthus annuus TaxID=4232 RepID=A0A251RQ01_HELAN